MSYLIQVVTREDASSPTPFLVTPALEVVFSIGICWILAKFWVSDEIQAGFLGKQEEDRLSCLPPPVGTDTRDWQSTTNPNILLNSSGPIQASSLSPCPTPEPAPNPQSLEELVVPGMPLISKSFLIQRAGSVEEEDHRMLANSWWYSVDTVPSALTAFLPYHNLCFLGIYLLFQRT